MCGPAAGGHGQAQHPPADAAALKPALMVVRALQIAATAATIVCVVWSLLYSASRLHYLYNRAPDKIRSAVAEQGFAWIFSMHFLLLAGVALSLSLSITWLVYTACPRQRARNARCMNTQTPGCMCYTCDMAWDIVLTIWWFGLCVALWFEPYAVGWLDILMFAACGLMTVLFLISAVLSGLVRKRTLVSQKCEKDVARKCDVELGHHPAGECDVTPPGVHCEVTRAAEPQAGLAVVGAGKV